jgi:hypothetical protein
VAVLERFEQACRRQPLLCALTIAAILFAVALAIYTPSYESNDDVGMSMVASGTGVAVAPDEHLIFSNVLIGLALKSLYQRAPNVPWYGYYLLAVEYAAIAALLYSVLMWRFSAKHLGLFALVFGSAGAAVLLNMQFTRVAFLAVESGIVLGLTALCRRADDEKYRPYFALCASLLLMVLGSLIRLGSYYGAVATGAAAAGFIGWHLFQQRRLRAAIWIPAAATFALTLALVVAADWFNGRYYARDPGWSGFFAFNKVRAQFNDFALPYYSDATKSVFDAVHWSANDQSMIAHWFFDDERVYSFANMSQVANGYPWAIRTAKWRSVPRWLSDIWSDSSLWVLWAMLPLFVWYAADRRNFVRGIAVLTAAIAVFLVALMCIKFPTAHVYYSLYAFQLLFALLLVRIGPVGVKRPPSYFVQIQPLTEIGGVASGPRRLFEAPAWKIAGAFALFGGIGVAGSLYGQLHQSKMAVRHDKEFTAALAQVQPTNEKLFVDWGSSLPLEHILPLSSPAKVRDLRLLSFGCLTGTPIHRAMKRRFGIDETGRSLYSSPNVYLVSDPILNNFYEVYAQEHYQVAVQWDKLFDSDLFTVWKPQDRSLASAGASHGRSVEPETTSAPSQRR